MLNFMTVGQGFPVVLLHGYELDSSSLMPLLEPFFQNQSVAYQRIYIDLPGMGKSRDQLFINSAKTLQMVVEVIKALQLSKFVVLGQSYGGYLATRLVNYFPQELVAQLLVVPMVVPATSKRKLAQLQHTYVSPDVTQFSADFANVNVVLNQLKYRYYQQQIATVMTQNQSPVLTRALQSIRYELPDLRGQKSKLATTALVGKYDNIVGNQDVERLRGHYLNLKLKHYQNSGHNLMIDETDRFYADLTTFLRTLF
ncbi:alpha/beta hydrolase [Fructilactobacillus hinvesii]|uniref:Alpha/beta hydrolase n=1 Tax=Fructilactobacillus hinvesii TaxID=2940300 RepID=A0ABY5BSC5_9LACO|nr:alpha/beta hydrolase [Fructilactobacillus hinvesii]USS87957.1 alpha/beta hydrolase [Fructilactobacillus hinvesii]